MFGGKDVVSACRLHGSVRLSAFSCDVAKVSQAPVDGAGFSVFVVSVCEPQPSANAGAVAKAIIRAARMNKRLMAGL